MRTTTVLPIALAAGLLLPAAASAQATQAGGSILWLVRPAGKLEPGRPVNGALSASDFYGPNDAYIDVWEIDGRAGGQVTIDLKTQDFDALLYAVGPGMAETLMDDDGGGRCDARITLRFLEDGTYRVAATVNGSRTTGVYTLVAGAEPGPLSAGECGGPDPAEFQALPASGRITPGTPVNGSLGPPDPTLANGAPAEAWEIEAVEGQTVKVRLQSDAFDSFLYVVSPDGQEILSDDDGGGDLHSEITVTFSRSGVWRIVASSVDSTASGAFVLTVSRE